MLKTKAATAKETFLELEDGRSSSVNGRQSAPLRENDSLVPPTAPTEGPEIDDLNPPREPSDSGIDDGLLPRAGLPEDPGSGVVPTVLPDVNVYQHKKTLAQGMMDLALLSANANQLRYVLESGGSHAYYYTSVVFITMSIVLQVAVGVGLIMNSRYNIKKDDEICKANKVNNFTVLGIFIITIVNVFISAFGVPRQADALVAAARQ